MRLSAVMRNATVARLTSRPTQIWRSRTPTGIAIAQLKSSVDHPGVRYTFVAGAKRYQTPRMGITSLSRLLREIPVPWILSPMTVKIRRLTPSTTARDEDLRAGGVFTRRMLSRRAGTEKPGPLDRAPASPSRD